MGEFDDRVVIVTGAAGGIGSVSARVFAEGGAKLVVTDRPGTGIDKIVQSLHDGGYEAVGHEGDLTDEADVMSLIKLARDTYGRLDVIDNVAGPTEFSRRDAVITETDADLWDLIIAICCRTAMLTAKHGIPLMLETGGGSIVNTSSGMSFKGDDHSTAYAAGKSAVNTMTAYIASQYGKQNIRCNAVAPGLILTPAAQNAPQPVLDVILANTMVDRLGDPRDIANAAAFLASDKASFINGQVLAVDGGHSSHQPHLTGIRDLFAQGAVETKI
ncbi:MAG: family oxidoreductase [Ilumatobacteraceae bacterium]|nr:family oxidoreductase [Ilumatobacteraceae bacterium]